MLPQESVGCIKVLAFYSVQEGKLFTVGFYEESLRVFHKNKTNKKKTFKDLKVHVLVHEIFFHTDNGIFV